MKRRFFQYSFTKQLGIYFVTLFLAVFGFCVIWYYFMTLEVAERSEDEALEGRVEVISGNLDSLLSTVNDYSKVIAYNDVVQQGLGSASNLTYNMQTTLQDTITRLAACCDGISSIYVFHSNGKAYVAGNVQDVDAIRLQLFGAESYSSVYEMLQKARSGEGTLLHRVSQDGNSEIVSYMRVILDLETLDPIGVLVTNIPMRKIRETFHALQQQDGLRVAVLDEEGVAITSSEDALWLAEYAEENVLESEKGAYRLYDQGGDAYKIRKHTAANGMYQLLVAMPRSRLLQDMQRNMMIILVIGFALCIGGAYLITYQIRRPLKNILDSMKKVQEEKLEPIVPCETNQELNMLQTKYNQMLSDMEALINQKVENQRMRRKYELELLQAQIKPHFLYNTLDSVCALALMGNTGDVFTMVQALGHYYRNSLHKGKESITVGEELEIVENYLIIQHYRYEDTFQVVYDVDEEVKPFLTIKLILQPIVENAIYHGFRDHELTGTITIRAKDEGSHVMLAVEDDGMGMKPERLAEVLSSTEENKIKRFGLFGTFQRIRLYYGEEDPDAVSVESTYGKGTAVRIRLPKRRGSGESDSEV